MSHRAFALRIIALGVQEVVRKELLERGDPATALVDFDTPLRTKTKVT